ncbi:MAG: hypothetical protein Q9225_003353 [Loekoesia sp. 1 TL-2023]
MAVQQPNFEVLSNSFINAGRQLSLLANVPVIDQQRQLRDDVVSLREIINEQFRALRTELESVGRRFDRVDQRFDEMNQQFNQVGLRLGMLELSSKAEARNQASRLFNSHVTSVETRLHALYNQRNEAVDAFPDNLDTLTRMNDTKLPSILKQLLIYCLESTGGTITRLLDFQLGFLKPELRAEFRRVYRESPLSAKLPPTNGQRHEETYCLRAYLVNTPTDQHTDSHDMEGGLAGIVQLGDFTGIICEGYQSGAAIQIRGTILKHHVGTWRGKNRYAFDHTAHQSVRNAVDEAQRKRDKGMTDPEDEFPPEHSKYDDSDGTDDEDPEDDEQPERKTSHRAASKGKGPAADGPQSEGASQARTSPVTRSIGQDSETSRGIDLPPTRALMASSQPEELAGMDWTPSAERLGVHNHPNAAGTGKPTTTSVPQQQTENAASGSKRKRRSPVPEPETGVLQPPIPTRSKKLKTEDGSTATGEMFPEMGAQASQQVESHMNTQRPKRATREPRVKR